MSGILEEFWIFSKEGEALVNFYKDPNANGYFNYKNVEFDQAKLKEFKNIILSNMQNPSQNKKKIMSFENDLIKYDQYLQNDLVIFYKTNPEVKEKKILNLCKMISEILEDAYPLGKLQLWDGNLSFFEKLRKKIVLFFKMSSL